MSDATLTAGTVVEADRKTYRSKHTFNAAELLSHAAKVSGRSVVKLGMEARRLRKSHQGIELDEYVRLRLYDPAAHSEEERGEFVSWLKHNPILNEVNDLYWFGVTEDKWLSAKMLEADGSPVPDTLGVIDISQRAYHGTQAINGPEALRALIGPGTEMPLFGKNIRGLGSMGVFVITAADDTGLVLRDEGRMSYEAFFEDVIRDYRFLLQRFVWNCAMLRAFTDTTATIRVINMMDGDGVHVPSAVLKLPLSRNPADNFWREGNMICDIDPETGEVRTLVRANGPELERLDHHPETGGEIIGRKLPHWQRLREVNERVARLHAPLNYQSTDIALTDDGPVVIEVNAGSSFTLPQYASGKGFFTPKVRALFRSYGSKTAWE